MNPELVNLRWSNAVLNQMNRTGVRGWTCNYSKDGTETSYRMQLTVLGMRYSSGCYETSELARAMYEYIQRRAYEVIDALCSHNLHWKLQQKILQYWIPLEPKMSKPMKWERDPEYGRLPMNGRLC